MRVSQRGIAMPASPIRKLVPFAQQAKDRGVNVYHLNIGQPDIQTPGVFYDYISKLFSSVVSYSPSDGIKELKEAFSSYFRSWDIDISSDELLVTSGGSEAIQFALAAVADPGDDIMLIEPFYANYRGFANILGLNVRATTSNVSNGYRLPDDEEMQKALTPKTRAILFSNPSNPTGVVYTEEELTRLIRFARKNNLFVICDEVYREIVFDGIMPSSIMTIDSGQDIIVVDSISKRFSSCGARIGCVATKNKELYRTIMKFAQARLSPPTIAQFGTIGLLTLGKEYTDSVQKEYGHRRDVVFEELSKIEGIEMKKPSGAFYISVKLPVENAEEFVKWMLTDFSYNGSTVMVAPLEGFYATGGIGTKEVRIAYVLSSEKMKTAIEILAKGLKEYGR
ncbi:MAG TPA: pyridoxal phosphate-dependent aminotransferase [Mesotoga infera]|uniref:Pyridoxal phosphate-dependent aminotransferase n=1 Tax=Mesotoga infera TaxID=1236046 RepID=A0A7C1GP17_9BACT|nr:pyridoxal phosphate-dependent aminotransferase [Mesotoga infera]